MLKINDSICVIGSEHSKAEPEPLDQTFERVGSHLKLKATLLPVCDTVNQRFGRRVCV
jgi:hypothetical protein